MAFGQPRSQTYNGAYYSYETVAGDGTTPTIHLQSLLVDLKPHFETTPFRGSGNRIQSVIIPGRQWSDITAQGEISYTEAHFPLDLAYSKATAGTPAGASGTNGHERTYSPNPYAADTNATASLVVGNPGSTKAEKCSGVVLTALGYKADIATGLSWEGITAIGQGYTTGATIPASPTTLNLIPAGRPNVRIYSSVDNTFASPVKLTGATGATWKHDNLRGPDWTIDGDQLSYASTVDLEGNAEYTLTLHRDSTSVAYFTSLTTSALVYIRTAAKGILIPGETTIYELFQHDIVGYVSNIDAPGANNGVLDWTFTITQVPDATWTGNLFQKFDVVSTTA